MIKEILQTPLGEDAIQDELSTLEGVKYMLYLCLRNNDGVELDNMSAIVDLDNLAEATAILDGMGEETENPPPETPEASP
jgi:hypothetical protein